MFSIHLLLLFCLILFSKKLLPSHSIKWASLISIFSLLLVVGAYLIVQNRTILNLMDRMRENHINFHCKFIALELCLYTVVLVACKYVHCYIDNTKPKKHTVLIMVLMFLTIFLTFAYNWAIKRFPLHSPSVIVFTLTMPIKGVDAEIVSSILFQVCLPTLITFTLFCLSRFFVNRFLLKRYQFSIEKIRCGVFFQKTQVGVQVLLLLSVALFAYIILFIYVRLYSPEYVDLVSSARKPAVYSSFYDEEYVDPQNTNITFPENKRNLIFILLESMESSYADKANYGLFSQNLIPNLTGLAQDSINFSNTEALGGGIDVARTGWTVAAMLAKMGGLPFALPTEGNTDGIPMFLPKAYFLTDILGDAGYTMRYVFGSDKKFASRDVLLETHGNVEIHDIEWYKNNGKLPKDYEVFWGFEDQKLYSFVKEELNDLGQSSSPFFLGLLTVDTHMPNGYLCSECETDLINPKFPILNVISCADQQIAEFISWCRTQSWYEQTTIVIMGDHLFMTGSDTNFFPNQTDATSESRRWIDIFINSAKQPEVGAEKNRSFSSFDMFPTILESIGVEVENGALGFGRSLFSGEKTIIEEFGLQTVNAELSIKAKQYEALLYE